jgi:hypothetical protein
MYTFVNIKQAGNVITTYTCDQEMAPMFKKLKNIINTFSAILQAKKVTVHALNLALN